ncbi:helix-turn-helix domain-containing protein [Streptomyces sp. NPDC050738]|uniref:helix-turn-helix domain-containing protein n=1 Tax=Streptomyces sp. NPDC050738 TaxID=3154744 RepID=UPI003424F09D
MTSDPNHPGEPHPAEDPAREGEDLAALLTRLLEEAGRTQKDLALASGIKYQTLNSWLKRTRGTSRVDPEDLRKITAALRSWNVTITPKRIFEAAGRAVPGPTDSESERRLVEIYRQLPTRGQKALIQVASTLDEAIKRTE